MAVSCKANKTCLCICPGPAQHQVTHAIANDCCWQVCRPTVTAGHGLLEVYHQQRHCMMPHAEVFLRCKVIDGLCSLRAKYPDSENIHHVWYLYSVFSDAVHTVRLSQLFICLVRLFHGLPMCFQGLPSFLDQPCLSPARHQIHFTLDRGTLSRTTLVW